MTKILVTGCAGFIGYHLTKHLVEQGFEVDGVDNLVRGLVDERFRELLENPGFQFIQGDLLSDDFIQNLSFEYEYIYHLAAINGTQNFYLIPFQVSTNSAIPTWKLVNKYKTSPYLKKFVFAGTPESYASTIAAGLSQIPTPENVVLSISDPRESRWSYAAAKIYSESLIASASNEFGFPYLIMRYHNVFGSRMGDKHFIPDFIKRASQGDFTLWGGEETRTFLHVSSAVEMTIRLAQSEGRLNEIYNIGGQTEIKILEIAKMILNALKIDSEPVNLPGIPGSVLRRMPDMTKTLKHLNIPLPEMSLAAGINEVIEDIINESN